MSKVQFFPQVCDETKEEIHSITSLLLFSYRCQQSVMKHVLIRFPIPSTLLQWLFTLSFVDLTIIRLHFHCRTMSHMTNRLSTALEICGRDLNYRSVRQTYIL